MEPEGLVTLAVTAYWIVRPVEVTDSVCAGSAPCCKPRNNRVAGEATSAGLAVNAKTTNSEICPLAVVNVTVPLYEPGASPVGLTVTLTEVGVAPADGLTVSQGAELTAVQGSVRPSEFTICTVWKAGAGWPDSIAKLI